MLPVPEHDHIHPVPEEFGVTALAIPPVAEQRPVVGAVVNVAPLEVPQIELAARVAEHVETAPPFPVHVHDHPPVVVVTTLGVQPVAQRIVLGFELGAAEIVVPFAVPQAGGVTVT